MAFSLSSLRPKKIDIYLTKVYIGPFILTFFVALFVLVMQFLWKYIDDMVGKGIGNDVVFELLFYASASLAPMALPLAILLSSIMTFGNMGERFELTAAKASGISLLRYMRSLIIFSCIISIFAFFFSNYLLPKANLKYQQILFDVRRLKPTLNIKPNVFYNGIDNFTMRVSRKDEDAKGTMYDILLYDHAANKGNNNVLMAEKGELYQTNDGRTLILTLYNGRQYQEKETSLYMAEKFEFYGTTFTKWEKRFDLTQFQYKSTNSAQFSTLQHMLNLTQLNAFIDTIDAQKKMKKQEMANYLQQNTMSFAFQDSLFKQTGKPFYAALKSEPAATRNIIFETALTRLRNTKSFIEITEKELYYRDLEIIGYDIERHRKFTLSIACLVLFFVGAPLGAIIRKGGLGWPMFFSVVLFIIFHVSGIIGEKMAKERAISAAAGMWMATALFLPVGLFLTIKAKNDSALFNIETYQRFVGKLIGAFKKEKK
jgi:lipopolysaccharide export system permease protein